MGNTPSKEPQGRPVHKLCKPRVASFQTAPLATPDPKADASIHASGPPHDFKSIPYSTISSNSNFESESIYDSHANQTSDKSSGLLAPKVQRRLSLFRSKSSQESSGRRTSRRNTIIGSPTVLSQGEFGSVVRASSVSTHNPSDMWHRGLPLPVNENWPLAADRASWAYDLSSYEAQRVLSIVQDQPQPLLRSQTSASLADSRHDFMTRRRASMFVQPQSAPISRTTSEVSLHPPMRRRSMIQTPGVATRPRPSPTPARSTRASARHSHPPTPSMSRQPSTHFEEDEKHMSLPLLSGSIDMNGETCLISTPKDADYSSTGAFKFGTLRITNGSPVLTPNPVLSLSNDTEHLDTACSIDGYFTVETQREVAARNDGLDLIPVAPIQVLVSDSSDNVQSDSRAAGQETVGHSTKIPEPDRGGQNASEPLFDLELIQAPPASPLLTQSRQAAVDDDLFEDVEELCVPEVLDVRVDLNARSFPMEPVETTDLLDGVNRSDSGFVSNSKSTSSQSRSSLAKADSGYSSNVSVRSLRPGKKLASPEEIGRNSTSSDRASPMLQRAANQRPHEIQVPCPAAADRDRVVDSPQSEKAPTPPPKDDYLLKQISRMPPSEDNVGTVSTKSGTLRSRQPPPITISKSSESQELMSPNSLPLSPMSATSDGSLSSLSIGNNVQKSGRLQRFLSLRTSSASKQPYAVHVTHSVGNDEIPSIPKEVEAKLRERTGLYPITTKRLALKSQMSKETLKTILSVGSLEYANDDHLPRTPTFLDNEDEQDKTDISADAKEKTLRQSFSSMQSNFKTAAASMMFNRKQITRRPVPLRKPQDAGPDTIRQDEGTQPTKVDVASQLSGDSSLGGGRYNSAARPLSPSTRARRTMSMTAGHDRYSQLRTYSLQSSDLQPNTSLNSTTSPESNMPPQRKTSPPISMVTRNSFRTPPPRSPVKPQGPAVLPAMDQEKAPRPLSHSAASAVGHRLGHRGLSSSRPPLSASAFRANTSTRDSLSRHSSLVSQTPSLVHSRHASISSGRSGYVRDSRDYQTHGQFTTAAPLKQRSSLDAFDRLPLDGIRVPHSAQQGHKFQHDPRLEHWESYTPARHSADDSQQSWSPPYVPRGQHRRNVSFGSCDNQPYANGVQTPYRILHSYNSPAYRNAPIWG